MSGFTHHPSGVRLNIVGLQADNLVVAPAKHIGVAAKWKVQIVNGENLSGVHVMVS